MDVVYPYKSKGDDEELRYSLRSLKNLPHGKVVIVGDRPEWLRDVYHIPVKQRLSLTRFENSARNIYEASCDPKVSEDFILMNGDFYITKPIQEIPTYHRGNIAEVVSSEYGGADSLYIRIMKQVHKFLKSKGYPTLCYELHCPMVINKTKYREIHKLIRNRHRIPHGSDRTLYGNMTDMGGTKIKDVKVYRPNDPIPDTEFLSSSPKSWVEGAFRDYIRASFPDKSKYEKSR